MKNIFALFFLSLIALPSWAEISVSKVVIAASLDNGESADLQSKNIPVKTRCLLFPIVLAVKDGQKVYYGEVKTLFFNKKSVPVVPFSEEKNWDVHWYKIEPMRFHLDGKGHDPDNPDYLWYTNAGAPGSKTNRKPLFPDAVKFKAKELPNFNNKWVVQADAHPTNRGYDIHRGLGTMRYAVKIKNRQSGQEFHTPTLENYKFEEDGEDALTVIVRQDDSYLGFVTGFFNVPGVFGSYDHQVINHIGVDCADLVVGARREFSHRDISFTNVTGLRYTFVSSGEVKLIQPDLFVNTDAQFFRGYDPKNKKLTDPVELKMGVDGIQPGDIILFNYSPDSKRRSWDHVGLIYEDKSEAGAPDGILNKWDLVLNAGPSEANLTPLGSPGFLGDSALPIRIAMARWKS